MSTEKKVNYHCSVYLCIEICVTWEAATVVSGVSFLDAGASILAWWGAAWRVGGLTVFAGVLLRTATVVWSHLIHTCATIKTMRGSLGALIDVLLASLTIKRGRAGADVSGLKGWALATVCTWIGSTWVGELAGFALKTTQQKRFINHASSLNETKENKRMILSWATYLTIQGGIGSGMQSG